MTCYDLRFPELARALTEAGAEALVVPAAWVAGERKVEHWRTLLRARAIENTVWVVGVGQPGPRYTGHSLVVAPDGDVVVEAGEDADRARRRHRPRRRGRRCAGPTPRWPTAASELSGILPGVPGSRRCAVDARPCRSGPSACATDPRARREPSRTLAADEQQPRRAPVPVAAPAGSVAGRLLARPPWPRCARSTSCRGCPSPPAGARRAARGRPRRRAGGSPRLGRCSPAAVGAPRVATQWAPLLAGAAVGTGGGRGLPRRAGYDARPALPARRREVVLAEAGRRMRQHSRVAGFDVDLDAAGSPTPSSRGDGWRWSRSSTGWAAACTASAVPASCCGSAPGAARVALAYAAALTRYGAADLIAWSIGRRAWVRDHLGAVPHPIEVLVGVPGPRLGRLPARPPPPGLVGLRLRRRRHGDASATRLVDAGRHRRHDTRLSAAYEPGAGAADRLRR